VGNLILIALLLAFAGRAQPQESPVSTLQLAEFGATLRVPAGWTAAQQEQPGALMLANSDRSVVGFLFLKSGVSESEMAGFFTEKTEGVTRLRQAPMAGYDKAWSFDFLDADLGLGGTGRAALDRSSTAVLVLLVKSAAQTAPLSGAADQWIQAVRFNAAQAARPKPAKAATPAASPFSGRHIHAFKSYSGGDYFESTSIHLDLCADGTYAATVRTESSSVSGVLGPSQKTEQENGTWSVSGAAAQWTLTLRTSEGGVNSVPVRTGDGLRFGDMPAQMSAAEGCR